MAVSAHQPKELCLEGNFAHPSVQSQVAFLMHFTQDKPHSLGLPNPPRCLGPCPSCRALVPHCAMLLSRQESICDICSVPGVESHGSDL